MKVLVTGAGALLGQGIIRSLRRSSLDVQIVAVDPSPLAAGLYWADTAHLVPMATDPSFMAQFQQVLERERPAAVLVGTDVELPLFAEQRSALLDRYGIHVVVSDPHVVAIANDKYLTFEFLRDHGFDPPDSCLPGEEQALVERVGFPLVVKPRVGARSVGVGVARDWTQLRALLDGVSGAIIQECVGGPDDEYTAGALCFDGQCDLSIVMRRDLRDGNTYRAFVDPSEHLNAVVRDMARALAPFGPVNFQFRRQGDRVRVFEINGRFSGTTPLRGLAGFNEVELCLRKLVLGEPVFQPAIEPLVILRHWEETVVSPERLIRTDDRS